ncbi:MAG: hypothetical protein ABL967_00275 [Bryobacteraceae bacterium]
MIAAMIRMRFRHAVGLLGLWMSLPLQVHAQYPPAYPTGPAETGRKAAPFDITGYWVSVVTEDWRWRMFTPPKGDYTSVPLNAAGKAAADAWDPAKDEAAGEQCKSYAAPSLLRIPGRIHITWADDNTLKVETDAGQQTRLLHFGDWKSAGGAPTYLGESLAQWDETGALRAGRAILVAGKEVGGRSRGTMKVSTTRMRPGYLRKNGVPYSANATLTEYFDPTTEANGDQWLWITTIVDDRQYLNTPFITSVHFKKQADGTGWDPAPCSSR